MNTLALIKNQAPGYNSPAHLAMFVSQWAHYWLRAGIMSHDQYSQLQNAAYELFGPWPAEEFTAPTYKPCHGGYPTPYAP